jgi:plastocyanin
VLGVIAGVLALAAAAPAASPPLPETGVLTPLGAQVQHLHFKYGPIHVLPGQNTILLQPVTIEKPLYDGYVTSFKPDLVRADGTVPPVDVIHLHHGVWLNLSRSDSVDPRQAEKIFASGEEKTRFTLPRGYGYPVSRNDVWAMNYMVHNQTPVPDEVFITYDIDYVPKDTALGRSLKPAYPFWTDVRGGEAYPVFDSHRGQGGSDGEFTYPAEAPNPYPDGNHRNVLEMQRAGTLIAAAGHVHPGGLHDDLYLDRDGRSAHLFRSDAKYYDPSGPVSWDMSMTATPPGWRVGVKPGDKLRIETTYENQRASWYESMGIIVGYITYADSEPGPDPFVSPPPLTGDVTHGPLPENSNHGGGDSGLPDPRTLPDQATVFSQIGIAGFTYMPGNLGTATFMGNPPTVPQGQSLTFDNFDASANVFHTITACKAPCNRSTGISYPLADGDIDFDSAELGYGPTGLTAASNQPTWNTPPTLPVGTYTYFCRVHPYMRGAFRVVPK